MNKKLSLGKFVQVMTGGQVVTAEVVVESENKADIVADALDRLQVQLTEAGMTWTTLTEAIRAYRVGRDEAARETAPRARAQKFDELESSTQEKVDSLAGKCMGYVKDAVHHRAMVDDVNGMLEKETEALSRLTNGELKALLLSKRMAKLLSIGMPVDILHEFVRHQNKLGDAEGVAAKTAMLYKIRTAVGEINVADYAVKDAEYDRLQRELPQNINSKESETSKLPDGPIRQLISDGLALLRQQLMLPGPMASLGAFDAGLESLKSVDEKLSKLDVAESAGTANEYQSVLDEMLTASETKLAEVANLDNTDVRSILDAKVRSILQQAEPLTQLTLDALSCRLAALRKMQAQLQSLDIAAMRAKLQQYDDLAKQTQQVMLDKATECAQLTPSPGQALLVADLQARPATIPPLAGLGVDQIDEAMNSLEKARLGVVAINTGITVDSADRYEQLRSEVSTLLDAKTLKATRLPMSPYKDILLAGLDANKRQLAPPTSLEHDALEAALKTLAAQKDEFQALDVSSFESRLKEYTSLRARVQTQLDVLDAEVARLPVGLKSMFEARLESEQASVEKFGSVDVTKLDAAIQELQGKATKLEKINVADVLDQWTAFQKLREDFPGLVDSKVLPRLESMRAGARQMEIKKIKESVKNIYNSQIDDIPNNLNKLREKTAELDDYRPQPPNGVQRDLKKSEATMTKLRKAVKELPNGELRVAAIAALAYADDCLDRISVGTPPEKVDSHFMVGVEDALASGAYATRVTLEPSELARATKLALKALDTALNEQGSVEQQLLTMEGEEFAKGMVTLNVKLIGFGANHKGITDGEALSIMRYTGQDYGPMNRERRGLIKDERLALLNKTCDEALHKLPPYPATAWPTFRAERAWSQEVIDERYAKGKKFQCGVLWSTGARGAVDLGGSSPKFLHVIYGKSGRDVAAMCEMSGEGAMPEPGFDRNANSGRGEVLFRADTEFWVSERKDPADDPEALIYRERVAYPSQIETKLTEN